MRFEKYREQNSNTIKTDEYSKPCAQAKNDRQQN